MTQNCLNTSISTLWYWGLNPKTFHLCSKRSSAQLYPDPQHLESPWLPTEKFKFLHTKVTVPREQWTAGQMREGRGTWWMPHSMLAFDGHGPEKRAVSFHSHDPRPIVGVRSTDQCSKGKHIICEVPLQARCCHLAAMLSNRNKATPAAFHSSVYT